MARDLSITEYEPPFVGIEYIDSAPLTEVLHEQIDYLMRHASPHCAPGCADCARLQQVQTWLLLPFRRTRRLRAGSRAA
jgi:hypothetical protein